MLVRDRRTAPPPGRSVLVLHDDENVRDTIVDAVQGLRVPVYAAATIGEAQEHLDDKRPAVIIADYGLGDGTCVSFLFYRHPCHRAIIVSGKATLADLDTIARGLGADLRETPATDSEIADLVALVRSLLDTAAPHTAASVLKFSVPPSTAI